MPRRAGPVALVGAALLFGALSVGYAWIVARHLRNDARETSRLLGHVFAGLNDPREGAAAGREDTQALFKEFMQWRERQGGARR